MFTGLYFSVIIIKHADIGICRFFHSFAKSGDGAVTVYEALSLMIAFATLVVLIISFRK